MDARVYYHKGNAYFEKGQYEKAIENYNMAILLNPTFSESYFARALSYYYLKNFDKAIADYTKASELDPNNPVIYNNKGDAYYRKKEFDKAIEDYEKAIMLNDKYLKAYYNRGLSYACKEDFESAIKDFTKVIELNPNFAEAYHVRGLAYDYLNRLDDAVKDYNKALELNPNLEEAKQHLELAKSKMSGEYVPSESSIPTTGPGQGKEVDTAKFLTKPDMSFADVAGMEKLKEELREAVVYPLKRPDLAEEYGVLGGGGILLYGPPGCGKSYVMKASAGECEVNFLNVKLSDILDQYVGGTEKNIHKIFETARKNTPCILFIDEIDALGGRRDQMGESAQYLKAAVNQLLYEIDGVESSNKDFLIVGATNAPWDVDPALRRAGRLGKLIYVPEPDFTSRKEILKLRLKKKLPADKIAKNIAWNRLALATWGYAAADLRAIVDEAAARPWREAFHKIEKIKDKLVQSGMDPDQAEKEARKRVKLRKVGIGDLIAAVKKKKSSLPPWYAQANKQIGKQEEKTIVDGKEHIKITESKLGPAEKDQFKALLDVINKRNKWYNKLFAKIIKNIGLWVPIPF